MKCQLGASEAYQDVERPVGTLDCVFEKLDIIHVRRREFEGLWSTLLTTSP
jgi:hypothetical protein